MRIVAIIIRIFQQLRRDPRTLALLFIAPLFILSLMHYIFGSESSALKLVVSGSSTELVEQLRKADFEVEVVGKYTNKQLEEEKFDGFLKIKDNEITLVLLNDEPSRANALRLQLSQHLKPKSASSLPFTVEYVYGSRETTIFDTFSPMLVGYFVFFFVFLIAGIALLKERTSGTLERLLSTPIKRYEIVLGYVLGYGIFALIQTVIVVLFSVTVLDIVLVGSIWLVLLINILVAFVALAIGTFLSSFASSEFQMIQFIPIVIIPQIFFMGIFPLDGMADWLQQVGKVMPMYYAADALKGVMYKGWGIVDISTDLLVLCLFAIVFIVLNIVSLKKYRVL